MTGWPSRSDTYWPISRPRMSAGPPGGKPETMWIGRDGQVSARASRDASGSAAAPAVRCRKRRRANMAFSSRVGAHLRAGYLAAGWREKVGRRRSGYVDAAGSAMNQTRENHETSLPTRNGANAITNREI